MKNSFRTKILVIMALIMVSVGLIIFFRFPIAGFSTLEPVDSPTQTTKNPPSKPKQSQSSEQKHATKGKENVSINLSYQVIEPTKLSARLVKGNLLPCPQYSKLDFEVNNTGKTTAQQLFVSYPSNLQVLNCINCSLKHLNAGQSTTVKLNSCKSKKQGVSVEFSSINAPKQTVKIKTEKQ